MQVYGRRAEKRLLWLTFSAIEEPENRASEIAIGPAAGLPEWNGLHNDPYANQISGIRNVAVGLHRVGTQEKVHRCVAADLPNGAGQFSNFVAGSAKRPCATEVQ